MLQPIQPRRGRSPARPLLLAAGLATLAAWASPAAAQARVETVYGRDNRVEASALTGAKAAAARATVALVDASSIRANGDGTSTLVGPSLRESQALCPGQRFAAQPVVAFCSGVLLGPDIVATAGHCVDRFNLSSARFVFDFAMIDTKRARTTLPNGRIYRARRILSRTYTAAGADYAVVQLARRVGDRAPATLRRTGRIPTGTPLYVIGHPSGLPAKLAGQAEVQANASPAFFRTNLDTFGGNSGSPVFEAETNRVAGLLVRGNRDYRETPRGCFVANTLPEKPGKEEVTRATVFAPYAPVR